MRLQKCVRLAQKGFPDGQTNFEKWCFFFLNSQLKLLHNHFFFAYKLKIQLSLINLGAIWAGAADIPAFRSMRTLRALRPLRAVSRWEGMRVSTELITAATITQKISSANFFTFYSFVGCVIAKP